MKYFILFAFCVVNFTAALGQTGKIRGKVTDAQTGETLPGVNILIKGTTTGAVTDLDGVYTISVEPGSYDVQYSFVSFETKVVSSIVVKANEVTVVNVALGSNDIELQEVVVEAKVLKNTDNALLSMQKKAAVVSDGISAQQFSRAGDSDAGSAIKRVTGVSVEGGKYVYVRGLGDRYSKATLNMAEIPGLDPNRNAVQMDLFPSNLLENLRVFKTFSPDLTGDFSGGYVNITTKDFPDRFTFQWSSSFGYNTNATFNKNFLTYEGSNTDWLGFDGGARELPDAIKDGVPFLSETSNNDLKAQELDKDTKSFNKTMAPIQSAPIVNQSHSFSIGNQVDLFGKPFGFVVGLSYQNENNFYEEGRTGRYTLSSLEAENLNKLLLLDDSKGTNNVLIGALANFSYKLSNNHKVGLNLLRNQSGEKTARYQKGLFPANFGEDSVTFFETRTLAYLERSLTSGQLKGEHLFPTLRSLKVEWHTAYTISNQNEPDLRFFANDFNRGTKGEDTTYAISASIYRVPSRFYRNLDEVNIDNKINFTLPVNLLTKESKLKAGFSYLYKSRSFEEKRYDYKLGTRTNYNGNVDEFLNDQNIGIVDQNRFGYIFGPVIQDASERRNSYDATQVVMAAYLLGDLQLTNKLRVNAGARLETTDIEVTSVDPSVNKGLLNNVDVLPGINLTYEVVDNQNIRLGYSKTLARPTFRELAPFASFDFIGDFVLVGNPNLQRTLIDNFDIRWEIFPKSSELFAISAFYKAFDNPIEKVIEPRAQNTEFSYQNVPQGRVIGAELEIKKNLAFISPVLENFGAGLNLTIVDSKVDISERELAFIRAVDPNASDKRQMFAQSPYLFNAYLNYDNFESGWSASTSFNLFGERLVVIAAGATPDVYEQPRPQLNANVTKRINNKFKVKASASNILNPDYKFSHEYRGKDFIYQNYKTGVDFSIGFSYLVE